MTEPTEQIRIEAQRWLRFAKTDLAAAEVLSRDDYLAGAACFHAQQAVEKALKAALVFRQIEFPRTHDIGVLRMLIPTTWEVYQCSEGAADLSDWAVQPRYPGDRPDASAKDAEVATTTAGRVLDGLLSDAEAYGFLP